MFILVKGFLEATHRKIFGSNRRSSVRHFAALLAVKGPATLMLNRQLRLYCCEEVPSERRDGLQQCGVVCESSVAYCPRHAEESILYGVVAGNLETFLARQQQRERVVPRFVERELRSFLECGILAHGFARIRCPKCRDEHLLAFSCRTRNFCSGCQAKRAVLFAEKLTTEILAPVPHRHWTFSIPRVPELGRDSDEFLN